MEEVERQRTRVTVTKDGVQDTASSDYPINVGDDENAFDLEKFKEGFKIDVISMSDEVIEFDMIGINAALANTFRRILIAEVPTMAIEQCYIHCNTSIMHDEVFAHRLGLIPMNADPQMFDWVHRSEEPVPEDFNEENHLLFKLKAKCTKNRDAPADSTDPKELYHNSSVMSGDLKWVPVGNQKEAFASDGISDIRPVHDDILLVKLRPGQEVDIEMHVVKGYGKQHAKWSPVGTATYRLLPEIVLLKEFTGDLARELQSCFKKGVIELVDNGAGEEKAVVADARGCTFSREVHQHPDLTDFVRLQRVRDHFIFSVESTGALPAAELVRRAIVTLNEKIGDVLDAFAPADGEGADEGEGADADGGEGDVEDPVDEDADEAAEDAGAAGSADDS